MYLSSGRSSLSALGHARVEFRGDVESRQRVLQISEQKPEGIAQLFVELGAASIRFSLAAMSSRKSTLGDPQAHDLAAHAVGDIDRINTVAERF